MKTAKAFDPAVEWRAPASLTPYVNNAKLHPPEQIDLIAGWIKENSLLSGGY